MVKSIEASAAIDRGTTPITRENKVTTPKAGVFIPRRSGFGSWRRRRRSRIPLEEETTK